MISSSAADARPINCNSNVVPLAITRTNGPWTHTSDDSHIYHVYVARFSDSYNIFLSIMCKWVRKATSEYAPPSPTFLCFFFRIRSVVVGAGSHRIHQRRAQDAGDAKAVTIAENWRRRFLREQACLERGGMYDRREGGGRVRRSLSATVLVGVNRFVSVRFGRFGSVRFGSVRFGVLGVNRCGSVRFNVLQVFHGTKMDGCMAQR